MISNRVAAHIANASDVRFAGTLPNVNSREWNWSNLTPYAISDALDRSLDRALVGKAARLSFCRHENLLHALSFLLPLSRWHSPCK